MRERLGETGVKLEAKGIGEGSPVRRRISETRRRRLGVERRMTAEGAGLIEEAKRRDEVG